MWGSYRIANNAGVAAGVGGLSAVWTSCFASSVKLSLDALAFLRQGPQYPAAKFTTLAVATDRGCPLSPETVQQLSQPYSL